MRFNDSIDLLYKIVATISCSVTLYIAVAKLRKAKKDKTKRNAKSDVPK